MPSAITAIRRYPATLLLAVFLFIASFVIATGSFGKVGGGGSDDEGSGIGGTGRTGEFGGSGLGGTGAPSPLVTHNETPTETETETESQATPSPTSILALSPVIDLRIDTRIPDRVKSEILQELNTNIEQRALQLSESNTEVPQPAAELVEPRIIEPIQLVEASEATTRDVAPNQLAESVSNIAIDTTQELLEIPPVLIEPAVTVENQQLAEGTSSEPENIMEAQRLEMPERIQRPDLPPIQRVRPVERISIMPPRAQPMRI